VKEMNFPAKLHVAPISSVEERERTCLTRVRLINEMTFNANISTNTDSDEYHHIIMSDENGSGGRLRMIQEEKPGRES
jgi:hypothetical protein